MKIKKFSKIKQYLIWLKAMQIRKSVDIIDPFRIAEQNNIDVSFIDMISPPAFNNYNPQTNSYSIYISNNVDRFSAKILCAHELGHIFCDSPKEVTLFDHKIDPASEFIANSFASYIVPFDSRFKVTRNTTIEDYNEFVSSLILIKKT